MYVSGKGNLHPRGSNDWPEVVKLASPKATVRIARLKWDGNWNPEPLALERFSRLLAAQMQIQCTVADPVDMADLGKADVKFAILSGVGALELTAAQTGVLKAFVHGGGTVLIDAAGGDEMFYDSAKRAVARMYGEGASTLDKGAAVYNLAKLPAGVLKFKYTPRRSRCEGPGAAQDLERLRSLDATPMLEAVTVDGRAAIFLSREDIPCWACSATAAATWTVTIPVKARAERPTGLCGTS